MLAAAILALLSGCGGGGGSTDLSKQQLSMGLSAHAIAISATTNDTTVFTSVNVTFSDVPAEAVYEVVTSTSIGISLVDYNQGGSEAPVVQIGIHMKEPASLGPGTYQDTVTISACFDAACTMPLTASPQTVTVTYTVTQGAPSPPGIAQLNPATAIAGAGFSLTVVGTNFTAQSVVVWNGSPQPTTFVSNSELTAQIAGAELPAAGSAAVSVLDQGTQLSSGTLSCTIVGPQLTAISPSSVTAGAAGFVLAITGSNFGPQSLLQWNGSARPTTYVSATQLTAQISAADVAAAGSAAVTVANSPGAGALSNAQPFTIQPLPPLAGISVFPASVAMGADPFTLTILGQGFTSGSQLLWNGVARATRYVADTEILAQVSALDVAAVGVATLTVQNPAPYAGVSTAATLTVTTPSLDAVATQVTPGHAGAIAFNGVTLPSAALWSVNVGGTPSYALIAGGLVIVTVQTTGGTGLLALNQASGAIAWGPIALPGPSNAAYDANSVFVLSGSPAGSPPQGVMNAYAAATGNLQWSVSLGAGQSLFADAPVAANGFVYTAGSGSVGTLYALAESTGAVAWTQPVPVGNSSTPAVTNDGVYMTLSCQSWDFRPATGEQIWTFSQGVCGGGGGMPVAAGGTAYLPASDLLNWQGVDAESGTAGPAYPSLYPPALGAQTGYFLQNKTLTARTLGSGAVLWSFTGDGALITSPLLVAPYVFVGSSSGDLYAVDATSGTQVWQVALGAPIPEGVVFAQSTPQSALAAGDGLLVVPAGNTVSAFLLSSNP